jgi:hypothetical protein
MSIGTFAENVMVLGVENCLLRKLSTIFDSTTVTGMDNEMLARLASETKGARQERERLNHDLEILDRGLAECKKHRPRLSSGKWVAYRT